MYMIVEVSQYVAVASFSEAWIEIIFIWNICGMAGSPPSRRRGLKFKELQKIENEERSPPSRRRGLKFGSATPGIYLSRRLLLGGVD